MNAVAIPAPVEIDPKNTRNEQFKRTFESVLWGSMIAAVVLHFLLFQLWPTLTVDDVSFTAQELEFVELPPEIEIPPPPQAISRPATPVMSTVPMDDDVTIALTTFADNPVEELPLPPPTEKEEETVDISAAPVFTPMTVRPEIKNVPEILEALLEEYPPRLREAGVGGVVEVWFFISEEGRVRDRRVYKGSGFTEFDEAALRVADVFRFTPALDRDQVVAVWIRLPITFQVR
jgi:TonB family protein